MSSKSIWNFGGISGLSYELLTSTFITFLAITLYDISYLAVCHVRLSLRQVATKTTGRRIPTACSYIVSKLFSFFLLSFANRMPPKQQEGEYPLPELCLLLYLFISYILIKIRFLFLLCFAYSLPLGQQAGIYLFSYHTI